MKLRRNTRDEFFTLVNAVRELPMPPHESHIFLALMQEQEHNPLEIMQTCPPQYLDVSTISKGMRKALATGNMYYYVLRADTCDSIPQCFRTANVKNGAIAKPNANLYFPADIKEVEKWMTALPEKVRKVGVQTALADSFRKLCLSTGNKDNIAKVENEVLRGILYRVFYGTLQKTDGIMAGRFIYNIEFAVSKKELTEIQKNIKKWEAICAEPDLQVQTAIRNCFKNNFGNLTVSLYNAATEIAKMLDN